MTDSRDRTKIFRSALPLVPLALVLGACTATGDTMPEPTLEPAPSASATSAPPTPSSSPDATSLEFPEEAEGEVARAQFLTVGADGVPETSSIAVSGVTEGNYAVEGACIGTRAAYKVETAVPAEDRRVLVSASMACNEPFLNTFSVSGYEGAVQLTFTDTDLIETAWVRMIPAASAPQ